jgi:hypothetical protein
VLKCILHIGSAKTATSSLQELLYNSRESLARKGWLYPTSCLWRGDRSHNTLGIYFWDNFLEQMKDSTFAEVTEKLMAEISGWDNIIISSELIEKSLIHGNGNARRFVALLTERGYEISIVYVVRRQDHYLDSQFKQAVADITTLYAGSSEDFIARHAPALKYATTAAAWQTLPGIDKVVVLPFLEGRIRETFDRVLAEMGHPELTGPDFQVPLVNPSLEGIYLRLKHFLNRLDLPPSTHQRFVNSVASAGLSRKETGKSTLFSPQGRKAFLNQFRDDCAVLNEDFNLGAGAWLDEVYSEPTEFTPLRSDELSHAMDLVTKIEPSLAQDITNRIESRLKQHEGSVWPSLSHVTSPSGAPLA